jgi:hypothetical protein
MTEKRTAPFSTDDLEGIYRFLSDAAVVEGPPELRDIVAEYWPHLLHKVKPPRELMH